MEDMQFSESQTRTRWTDELVGILNSNTSTPDEKDRARRLLPRFASVQRKEPLQALLAEPANTATALSAFNRGIPIEGPAFAAAADSLLAGTSAWKCDEPCRLFFRVGQNSGHHCELRRVVEGLDARSLRALLLSRVYGGVGPENRARIYEELVGRGGLDPTLAWRTLDFEQSQSLALSGPVEPLALMHAKDTFLERLRAERTAAFTEAVASLSLPVPWLLRYGRWPDLADSAASQLLAPRYDPWRSLVSEVLAVAPDAAERLDAFLQRPNLTESVVYHLESQRLEHLPVPVNLVKNARAYRMSLPHVPIEVVHAACAHPNEKTQAHGVQALFERLGKEAPLEHLETALASGGLPRTVALRVLAARGEEDAITELIQGADARQGLSVHAESLRSLHLAGVPTSRFLAQALAGLHCLDSPEEAAPVASEAAHALWKADDLNGNDIVRALADAVTRRVPWPTWFDIDAAIGSWLGDAPDETCVRRQRCFF